MASTEFDISLSSIDTAKEPEKLVSMVQVWYNNDSMQRLLRASVWQQNIHFLSGDQWLRWNTAQNRWLPIPITPSNKSIDRPVANYIYVYVNTNAATFTGKPTMTVDPNSDDPRDKTCADVSTAVQSFLWEELDKDAMYDEAALWGLTCGITFRKSMKTPSGQFRNIPIPQEHPSYAEESMKQGTPEPIKKLPIKKVSAEVVPPFNIAFDGLGKRMNDVSVIMETQIRRLDWIKRVYGKNGPGYTGKASEVKEEVKLTNMISIGESLKDIVEGNTQTGYAGQTQSIKDSAVVHEVYSRPSEAYPMGRMFVIAGDHLVYDSALAKNGKSPYFYNEGKIWHPYTWWVFQPIPGSIYGISLVQQLIPKQRSINSIDALLAYNRKTVGIGQWLIHEGANIPDESIMGVPGQNITYRPGPRGEKPEKTQGTPLPAQVIDERNMHLADMDRIANSADIRSGMNPRGVTTVGQLQILNENARQSISKPVDRWEKFIERSETLDLLNFQSCYEFPDEQTIQKLKKYSKDILGIDWETFIGEEVRDNVNVRVEKGSTVVKSRVVQQEMILNLANAGLLPEIMGDPYLHKLLLEKFGLSDLVSDNNMDVKKAEKAIEMMLGGIYPPVDEVDNPDVQVIVLTRFMKSPKFMEVDDNIKLLFKRRFNEYTMLLNTANAVPDDGSAEGVQPNQDSLQKSKDGGKINTKKQSTKINGKASTGQGL